MSRVLVYGLCPLPFEDTRKNYGPGIRSWQFALSLAQAGHEVKLVAMVIPDVYEAGQLARSESREGVEIVRLTDSEFMDPSAIRRMADEWRPDAVVGATIYGSFALTAAKLPHPFWADQFGHVMAEAQAKALVEGANWPVAHFWKMVEPVMLRADKISTVSQRQLYAAIGELGAVGRLNRQTCGYDLLSVVPCALIPPNGEIAVAPVLKGEEIPEDAFVVFWSGGFNVWSDVETLFAGVESAMAEDPRVYLVSTGGAIEGQDTRTYGRFQELIAGSALSDRFLLRDWLPARTLPSYLAEADLGVLAERKIYEGMLGSKNRIIQWMGSGLPVACTRVGDLGELIDREDLGLVFEPGDAEALGQRILWAAGNPRQLREIGERARETALRSFSFGETTRDLRRWADRPARAPDADKVEDIAGPRDHSDLRQEVAELAKSLAPVRRSRLMRTVWRRYFSR